MGKEIIGLLNNFIDLVKMALPYLFALLVSYFGYQYGMKRMRFQKRLDFLERQLREFYSPMVGCLKSIKAKSEVRYEIEKASDPAWKKICEEHKGTDTDYDKLFEPFQRNILYNNTQLRNVLMPLYDDMLSIFTKNLWLADSTTKGWYLELSRFVDIWHRWLDKSIPVEVIKNIDHTEARLKPFYEDLENKLEDFQNELSVRKQKTRSQLFLRK